MPEKPSISIETITKVYFFCQKKNVSSNKICIKSYLMLLLETSQTEQVDHEIGGQAGSTPEEHLQTREGNFLSLISHIVL